MEKTITIPLEDALFTIPGVTAIQSSSENSLSSVYIRFKTGGKGNYEAVRDAAQRIYELLPSSVQRPEILSSGNSRIPVWSAAFPAAAEENIFTAQMLEKIIKPRLEGLEGAGEIFVSGAGLKEIYIILDQEKINFLGLEPQAAAAALGTNDSIFTGGAVIQQDREIIITVDGRYLPPYREETDFSKHQFSFNNIPLDKALIPLGDGKYAGLSEIAVIAEYDREPDILSRLNGKKTAGIAIMGRHDADLRKLSADIKKEMSAFPYKYTVLTDIGAEETAAFRSVFNAALLGAIMVIIISFILRNSAVSISGFFCALSVPAVCLISIAILSITGFPIDRLLLAGIAAGTGTAVDAVILCSEKLRKCRDYKSALLSLSELPGVLIAGAFTTIAALIPLSAIHNAEAGKIAGAISVVTLTALVMSLLLLPPLLLWDIESCKKNHYKLPEKILIKISKIKKYLSRLLNRFLASNVKFCAKNPVIILAISLFLAFSAITALLAKGADTSGYGSQDSVYAQVEFEGGLLAQETDRLLAAYGAQLADNAVIKNVETGARTGSGSLLISFDPKQTKAHLVRDIAKQIPIPGGFIFFHENTANDRYWEIKIYGDEEKKCRELAEELAYILSGHPLVRERVLNFKQGSKKMILIPDREIFAESGIVFMNAASKIRTGVYGPVAYKRTGLEGETDVRIFTNSGRLTINEAGGVMRQSREGALDILVSSGSEKEKTFLHIDSLMQIREETEPASIRRDNRRRTASITITTKPMDPRRVKQEIKPLFDKLELPPGYSVEFDPEAVNESRALSSTVFSLIFAVIFCYMIIASINESFTIPLAVLAAIPPSLSIPALLLVFSGSAYNSAAACAFIAVSGMTVNAAVLSVDSIRSTMKTKNNLDTLSVYLSLRRKMPALIATTCTTVAAAIPFLFLKEGANLLIKTISLVGALGVACSCLCSITVIPSLFLLRKNFSACAGIKSVFGSKT
jgi:multidrug efflux pump subunit AcrB